MVMYLENTIHITLKSTGKVILLVASATGNSIFVYQNLSIKRERTHSRHLIKLMYWIIEDLIKYFKQDSCCKDVIL